MATVYTEQETIIYTRRHALFDRFSIGKHVGKKKTMVETVKDMDPSRPWQFFVTPPRGCATRVDERDLEAAANIVAERGLRLFIHAPYTINLARPHDDVSTKSRDPDCDEGFHITTLRRNPQIGRALGALGVVVHLGAALKMPREEAVENMRKNILRVLDDASESCPLLLETGAGEGTELCFHQNDFVDFCASIPDPRLAVCLDTCHVHAAGQDVVGFINAVLPRLRLIHFNDSKCAFASRRDRHERVGMGTIGFDPMERVAEIAYQNTIPCVVE